MPETSDTYCSLCEVEARTEIEFFNHRGTAQHAAALLRVQADSLDLLLRIHDLLKQLVDKGQQVTPEVVHRPVFSCRDCWFGCDTHADWEAHQLTTQHVLGLVYGQTPR